MVLQEHIKHRYTATPTQHLNTATRRHDTMFLCAELKTLVESQRHKGESPIVQGVQKGGKGQNYTRDQQSCISTSKPLIGPDFELGFWGFWGFWGFLHVLFINPIWLKCSKLLLEQEAQKTLHVDLHIGVAHTSAVLHKILKIDRKWWTFNKECESHWAQVVLLVSAALQHCEISTLELGILMNPHHTGHEYNGVNRLVDGPGKPKASTRTIQISSDIYVVHFSSIFISIIFTE